MPKLTARGDGFYSRHWEESGCGMDEGGSITPEDGNGYGSGSFDGAGGGADPGGPSRYPDDSGRGFGMRNELEWA